MSNKPSILTSSMTQHQSGVVLAISLIMLLALTLIGITSSSVTGLEEKMAANSKDKNLAFQAAEAALRSVENSLTTKKPTFDYSAVYTAQGQGGLYTLVNNDGSLKYGSDGVTAWQPFYNNVKWNDTNKVATYSIKLNSLSLQPVTIIEEISSVPSGSIISGGSDEGGTSTPVTTGETVMFRITAHGWGSNNKAIATVQSIFKVTYLK
jgi:type IV pilus assembly protein PilX